MRILATVVGVVLMFVVLFDAFEAMVLPRRATRKYRLARYYYRMLWRLWVGAANAIRRRGLQQYFLSIFGPLSLLGLFVMWVTLLVLSFALFHWSLAEPMGSEQTRPSFATCAYLSGETFFTLGYGDFAPNSNFGRFLSVLEAGMGFGFMAVIIGYLPVVYQAFSRRERTIGLLDARAGSPPTAGQLLSRLAKAGAISHVDTMLLEWENWAVDLLESHLSYPVLGFYRSQHDNQSWLAGLATILDTCAILLANVLEINRHQVQVTFAMARHVAVDLALIFKTPPREPSSPRMTESCYRGLLTDLTAAGVKVDLSEASAARLDELRVMYEPYLVALANFFVFNLPPIVVAEATADNWQRSAWQGRTPGIGSLPIANPGDHFS